MRFSDPPGEAIVVDGKHVWVYTPSTVPDQVVRLSVPSGGPAYGYNLLAWLLDRPAERYRPSYLKSERIDGRTTDAIQLVPAVPDLPFTKAVVWLDRETALPRRLEIHEAVRRHPHAQPLSHSGQPVSAGFYLSASRFPPGPAW